jgi:hypothetical protein
LTRKLAIGFTLATVLMLLVQPFTKLDLVVTLASASAACFFWARSLES